jgi:hypothetical protein
MSTVRQSPKILDEGQLRAFYTSCGMSDQTIDRAINARRDSPLEVTGRAKRWQLTVKAKIRLPARVRNSRSRPA